MHPDTRGVGSFCCWFCGVGFGGRVGEGLGGVLLCILNGTGFPLRLVVSPCRFLRGAWPIRYQFYMRLSFRITSGFPQLGAMWRCMRHEARANEQLDLLVPLPSRHQPQRQNVVSQLPSEMGCFFSSWFLPLNLTFWDNPFFSDAAPLTRHTRGCKARSVPQQFCDYPSSHIRDSTRPLSMQRPRKDKAHMVKQQARWFFMRLAFEKIPRYNPSESINQPPHVLRQA